MESQKNIQALTWLFSGFDASFTHSDITLTRYFEDEFINNIQIKQPHRFRVIFDESAFDGISQWFEGLEQDCSIAVLMRHNSLKGVEIASSSRLTQLIEQFPADINAEILEVTQALPSFFKPGLLVMDMDSTAIQIECIDELAAMAGVGDAVSEVTERAMQGELDFEESLRLRVGKLAGASEEIITTLCQNLPLMPGLESLVAELKPNDWKLVLASGGFTPFVGHLKDLLKLDAAYANELVIEDGKLTGEVTGEVVDAQYKADVIDKSSASWQIAAGQRMAIGDGANDIPMVNAADFGVAFHAKPKLLAAADANIQKLDLRCLVFYLQG
ncbi:phosphoserine phosphatase SerB [Shewanella sp. 10N.286.51.B7]|uniref:phosphoserine phosphatase SerB n=1 Tax=Shewanella sp. 10N.286.51.B7 TaxID=1880836 RepID=UPI000C81B303|nr:phosphoserine phosphatase SerB [Shewanella sp. 10N.286.51.B7]PMG78788.1 phosphoserine phosphatase SerB [Shewanella sp. 10N.286.51.B7]